jgi:hypothetical protein
MQHIRNLLIFIGGATLSAVAVGLFFLLLSFLLPGLMAVLGEGGYSQEASDLDLGRQYFCTIGLAVGSILSLFFMTISQVAAASSEARQTNERRTRASRLSEHSRAEFSTLGVIQG